MSNGTKRCNRCQELKTLDGYHKNKKSPDGVCYTCRTCFKKASAERRSLDPLKTKLKDAEQRSKWAQNKRLYQVSYFYGLSAEEYEYLILVCGNACGICSKEFTDTPRVDHDHKTGKVRGLLCSKCNTGLGLLGDSKESLLKVMDYLESADLLW